MLISTWIEIAMLMGLYIISSLCRSLWYAQKNSLPELHTCVCQKLYQGAYIPWVLLDLASCCYCKIGSPCVRENGLWIEQVLQLVTDRKHIILINSTHFAKCHFLVTMYSLLLIRLFPREPGHETNSSCKSRRGSNRLTLIVTAV